MGAGSPLPIGRKEPPHGPAVGLLAAGLAAVSAIAGCGGAGGGALTAPEIPPLEAPSMRVAVVRLVGEPDELPADDGPYVDALRAAGALEVAPGWKPDRARADRLALGGPETLGPLVEVAADAATLVTLLREHLRRAYETMMKGKLEAARDDIASVVESLERNLEGIAGDPMTWAIRLEAYVLLGSLEGTLKRPTAKDRYAAAAAGLPIPYDSWTSRPVAVTTSLSPEMEHNLRASFEGALATRGRGRVVLRAEGAAGILVNGVLFARDRVELDSLVVGNRYYVAAAPRAPSGAGAAKIPPVRVLVAEPRDAAFTLGGSEGSGGPMARAPLLVVEGLEMALRDLAGRASLRRALDVHGAAVLRADPTVSAVVFVIKVVDDGMVAVVHARACARTTGCRNATVYAAHAEADRAFRLRRCGAMAGRAVRGLLDGRDEGDLGPLAAAPP